MLPPIAAAVALTAVTAAEAQYSGRIDMRAGLAVIVDLVAHRHRQRPAEVDVDELDRAA